MIGSLIRVITTKEYMTPSPPCNGGEGWGEEEARSVHDVFIGSGTSWSSFGER
jgi:hypothetical protein